MKYWFGIIVYLSFVTVCAAGPRGESAAASLNEQQAKERITRSGIPNTQDTFLKYVIHGDVDAVSTFLFAGMKTDARDERGNTALIWAANGGHFEVVKLLVKRGADVNARGGGGGDALMAAAYQGKLDIVDFLLKSGADPKSKNARGETPLMATAYGSFPEITQRLLQAGVDINAADQQGKTALMYAAEVNAIDVV